MFSDDVRCVIPQSGIGCPGGGVGVTWARPIAFYVLLLFCVRIGLAIVASEVG